MVARRIRKRKNLNVLTRRRRKRKRRKYPKLGHYRSLKSQTQIWSLLA